MPTIPSATTSVSAEASPLAGGTGYCVVFACCELNADLTPRVFGSGKALLAQHGYAQGPDYVANHIDRTKQPVIFIGLPTAVAGVVGRQDASRVTGSCVISVTPGANGYLEETDAELAVTKGGTIGTDDIRFDLTLDGGVTWKSIRLGKSSSYAVPYVGIVLGFAAGTLAVDDEYSFTTTAPKWDGDGIAAAAVALGVQQKPARSWLIIGDLADSTEANDVTTAINLYETGRKRFAYARANVRDRLPLAALSRPTARMTGSPTLTFAEVGATGDTITRAAGSWITDGFAVGMYFSVTGSASNNVSDKIAALSATVMTLGSTDLVAEVAAPSCAVVASPALTFAVSGHTITRSGGGSWFDDGFAVGDSVTSLGTASNNFTKTITALTSTVMTFAAGVVDEVIGSRSVTLTKGETMAAWVSAMDAGFTTVDAQKRINLGLGRLRTKSEITGWRIRRPVQWAASIREYQHDVHHPTWAKEDGPLQDWTNTDAHGNVEEFDEDTDGGGLAGRFTCARTWSNDPAGPFLAMDLTRDTEGSTLQMQHNLSVANVCCTVVQKKTENIVGKTPRVNSDGTATSAALQVLEHPINADLATALLHEFFPGEGPRASLAVWEADPASILTGPNATLTGAADLEVNGTVVHVVTGVFVT